MTSIDETYIVGKQKKENMSISATNTSPYYVEYINTSSDVSGIRKINESKLQNEEKTFLKYSTKDLRSIKVSEKMDENDTIKDYNIPLQQNTPTVRLLNILKSFNEAKKTESPEKDEGFADFTEIDESSNTENNRPSPDEIGFYVVINENNTNNDVKRTKKPIDLWRNRINSIYHLGFMKEPGTLVNAVV